MMVDEAAKQPIHVWLEMPSCIPSAPGFENRVRPSARKKWPRR